MDKIIPFARKTKMYFRVKYGLKTPLILIYFVTNKCNMRCKHCFYWKDLDKGESFAQGLRSGVSPRVSPLQLDEIRKIAGSLKYPLANLIITGGEPFLSPELTEVCKIYYEINHTRNFYFLTNGYLTDKIIETTENILKNMNPECLMPDAKCLMPNLHFQVSLDGTEGLHDEIRGIKGSFKNAVNTLNDLKSLSLRYPNIHTYILTVISKLNIKDLIPLSDFAIHKLGVPITFEFARGNALFKNNPLLSRDYNPVAPEEILLTYPEMEKAYKIVKEIYSLQHAKFGTNFDLSLLGLQKAIEVVRDNHKVVDCIAGNVAGVLYSDGNVSGCELINFNTNIRDFELDFYKLWMSTKLRNFRTRIKHCYCTFGCLLQSSLQNSLKYGLFYHTHS